MNSQLIIRNEQSRELTDTRVFTMIRVLSDALMAADRQQVTLFGLLDLSAAFDCVDHTLLLQRLAFHSSMVWQMRWGLTVDEIIRQQLDATSPVCRATVISATNPVQCTTKISPRSTALCYVHSRASPSGIKSWFYITSICRRLPSVPRL